jgi:hypothetical protein
MKTFYFLFLKLCILGPFKGHIINITRLPAAHFTPKGRQHMEEFRKPRFSIESRGFCFFYGLRS